MTILFDTIFFNISHKFLRDVISIPLVGSSKKIIELFPTMAKPIDNFRFWPPDKSDALVVLLSSRPISFNILFISSFVSFLSYVLKS